MNAPANIIPPANVYAKIAAVQGELARTGISKSRKNMTPGQNYNFRGIDEVYNVLSPLLAANGLCILPRIIARTVAERQAKSGNALFNVTVEAEFDFVSADDGSTHTVRTFGEAMDSSDKATNKAMSAAYKYAALMTFAVPTEGDNDADAVTHEVAARSLLASEDDVNRIISLCDAVGGNQAQLLCKAAGIQSLPDLPASKVAGVIKRLNEKLGDKAKAQSNAKAEKIDA